MIGWEIHHFVLRVLVIIYFTIADKLQTGSVLASMLTATKTVRHMQIRGALSRKRLVGAGYRKR